ncbi:MAG: DUF4328 domain-containing protein [Myxococcaceae bacterium]|nr:DUF4328 domain-containing protein [Myxococcaceae bacterium]
MLSATSTAARDVTCPAHPTLKPVGTCARCGRFVCARCETWDDCCAACEHRRLRELPSLRNRASLAQWSLALFALGTLLGAVLTGWLISRLDDGVATFEVERTYDRLSRLLTAPQLLAAALSVLFFLRWLHLAVRTAKLLGLDPGTTPGWAVAWWFVPLANLYDPYLVLRGLWRCLGGTSKRSAAVSAWWTAWVLGAIAWCVQMYLLWNLAAEPFLLTSTLLAAFAAQVILTIGALLCMGVIAQIQALADECMEDVAEAA